MKVSLRMDLKCKIKSAVLISSGTRRPGMILLLPPLCGHGLVRGKMPSVFLSLTLSGCSTSGVSKVRMWGAFRTLPVWHGTPRLEASPREECNWKHSGVPGVPHLWNRFTATWIDSFQVCAKCSCCSCLHISLNDSLLIIDNCVWGSGEGVSSGFGTCNYNSVFFVYAVYLFPM